MLLSVSIVKHCAPNLNSLPKTLWAKPFLKIWGAQTWLTTCLESFSVRIDGSKRESRRWWRIFVNSIYHHSNGQIPQRWIYWLLDPWSQQVADYRLWHFTLSLDLRDLALSLWNQLRVAAAKEVHFAATATRCHLCKGGDKQNWNGLQVTRPTNPLEQCVVLIDWGLGAVSGPPYLFQLTVQPPLRFWSTWKLRIHNHRP